MAQQLGSNYYNSPYKFNGKELDEETGFYYYGARYFDPRISIWQSVDPLAEKFPDQSPYSFVFNNPMRFVDPDGRAPDDIIVKGKLAQKYVDQLNSSSSLKITRNEKTGKLSATGEAKTEHDIQLLNAIKDEKITVNINATDKNKKDGKFIFGDSFDGSQKKKNGVVVAKQTINPNHAEVIEEFVGMDKGSVAKHGTLESYFGAQQSPGAYPQQENAYLKAHDATNLIYPAGDLRKVADKIDFNVEVRKSPYSKTEVWMTKIVGEKPLFE